MAVHDIPDRALNLEADSSAKTTAFIHVV